MSDNYGFTLIELIMVILIMSVLAIYAAPKFDISLFRNTNFFIQAMSSIRHAQKQAIASGCNVQITINSSGCNIQWSNPSADANCPVDATIINNPASSNNNFCDGATPSASPTGGSFRFDSIGRPMDISNNLLVTAQNIVIGDRTILVEAETGFTYEN